jgi:hypothetical protein
MSYKDTKKQLKEQGMILKSWYKVRFHAVFSSPILI